MSVKDRMAKAHRAKEEAARKAAELAASGKQAEPVVITTEEVKVTTNQEQPVIEPDPVVEPEPVIEPKPVIETPVKINFAPSQVNKTNTPIEQIRRSDVPLEQYGPGKWKSNFDLYNKEIVNFVRNFSTDNQMNNGCAITKAQLMEVILDVAYYDMELRPQGFATVDELRKYLQEKLR